MQQWLVGLLEQYASLAPLIVFLALVVAAFNIPISEDLTAIASGLLAATIAPEERHWLYVALLGGAVCGDMLCYALGRKVGRPLLEKPLFRRMLPQQKLERLSGHFDRHAALTILLGRLIPFGVRNAITMLAGITHLKPWKFLLLDSIPASITISLLYWLSLHYGRSLLQNVRAVQLILLLVLLGVAIALICRLRRRRQAG